MGFVRHTIQEVLGKRSLCDLVRQPWLSRGWDAKGLPLWWGAGYADLALNAYGTSGKDRPTATLWLCSSLGVEHERSLLL